MSLKCLTSLQSINYWLPVKIKLKVELNTEWQNKPVQ